MEHASGQPGILHRIHRNTPFTKFSKGTPVASTKLIHTQPNTYPASFILAADLCMTSPMHITAIEKGRYDPTTARLLRFDNSSGGLQVKLTRTRRMNDASFARTINPEGPDGGQVRYGMDVPIIPASTLTGRLRNSAAELIFRAFVERGLKVSPAAYNTLCTGSASAALSVSASGPEVVLAARRDAFLANFGGTAFAVPARTIISDGLPLIKRTLSMLMSPALIDADAIPDMTHIRQMASVSAVLRRDAMADMRGDSFDEVLAFGDIMAYAELDAARKERRREARVVEGAAQAEGVRYERPKKEELRTLAAMEVVDPGLHFAVRVRVDAHSPEQMGLIVLALQRLLRGGQIGGKAARGFGRFTCEHSALIQLDPQTGREVARAVLFGGAEVAYDVVLENFFLVRAQEACGQYLLRINPHLFEAFAKADADEVKRLAFLDAEKYSQQ